MLAGNATVSAAASARARVLQGAAELLEAKAEDLESRDGRITVVGSPERGVSFVDAVRAAYRMAQGGQIVGEGVYVPNPRLISPSISFSVQIAEVEVDRETGQVQVSDLTSAHDCGVPINPMSVEGQLEGSVYMGVGYALGEEFTEIDGQSIQSSFADYRVPTAGEMPRVETLHIEVVDPEGPYGAKEAGEGTVGPTAPAIANAIYDATRVRLTDMPLSPEKVLRAMEAGGSGGF